MTPATILYWNRIVVTDMMRHCSKLSITFVDKENKVILVIDVAVPVLNNL